MPKEDTIVKSVKILLKEVVAIYREEIWKFYDWAIGVRDGEEGKGVRKDLFVKRWINILLGGNGGKVGPVKMGVCGGDGLGIRENNVVLNCGLGGGGGEVEKEPPVIEIEDTGRKVESGELSVIIEDKKDFYEMNRGAIKGRGKESSLAGVDKKIDFGDAAKNEITNDTHANSNSYANGNNGKASDLMAANQLIMNINNKFNLPETTNLNASKNPTLPNAEICNIEIHSIKGDDQISMISNGALSRASGFQNMIKKDSNKQSVVQKHAAFRQSLLKNVAKEKNSAQIEREIISDNIFPKDSNKMLEEDMLESRRLSEKAQLLKNQNSTTEEMTLVKNIKETLLGGGKGYQLGSENVSSTTENVGNRTRGARKSANKNDTEKWSEVSSSKDAMSDRRRQRNTVDQKSNKYANKLPTHGMNQTKDSTSPIHGFGVSDRLGKASKGKNLLSDNKYFQNRKSGSKILSSNKPYPSKITPNKALKSGKASARGISNNKSCSKSKNFSNHKA